MPSASPKAEPSPTADRRWPRLLLTLALPMLPLVAAHAFFLPMYDLNDDPGMDMVARGVGYTVSPSPFLWYSNVLYGRLLTTLYGALPAWPWYRLLALAFQYLAGVAIAHAALRRGLSFSVLGPLAVYFVVFDLTFYVHPTFTVTAALLAAGAVALWTGAVLDGRRMTWPALAAFASLLAPAAMLRTQSALLVLALALPGVVLLLLRGERAGRLHRLASGLAPAAGALLLIAALQAYDRHAYATTPGWEDFHETHELISEFVDFERAVYTPETKAVFDEVGWSANDFLMLQNWFYSDRERFSLEKMKTVLAAFPRHRPRLDRGFAHLDLVRNDPYVVLMLAALLVAALFVAPRDGRLTALAATWLAVLALAAYLVFVLHRFPPRTYQPMLAVAVALSAVLAAATENTGRWPPRIRVVALLALAIGLPGLVSIWHGRSEFGAGLNSAFREAVDQLPRQRLLVVWGAALPIELTLPLSDMHEYRGLRLYSLGSDTRSPYNAALLEEFGIEDIYRAIYTRDDVLVIGSDALNGLLVRYAAEHYGDRVSFWPVARYGKNGWHLFTVYRFAGA